MHKWIDLARDLWCELFHDQPMWPINGRYQCGSCLRYHPVRWERRVGQRGPEGGATLQKGHATFTRLAVSHQEFTNRNESMF